MTRNAITTHERIATDLHDLCGLYIPGPTDAEPRLTRDSNLIRRNQLQVIRRVIRRVTSGILFRGRRLETLLEPRMKCFFWSTGRKSMGSKSQKACRVDNCKLSLRQLCYV